MIKISDNRRFLIHSDGRPFFYLADTAWELFHRLDRPQTLRYLADRAAKGFTVLQAVALAEVDGLHTPNAEGHLPFENDDPTRPVEAYWRHIDWVIDEAAALGLHIGLLPTWGDKWNKAWGAGPQIFTPDNAFAYGRWLARRYHDKPLIWITGGDRKVETPLHHEILSHMARGLREGDKGEHLISFHPPGGGGSSQYFHAEPWLDFNMWQTGHTRNSDNYNKIAQDYGRNDPVKPVLDAEPGYEDHPSAFNLDNGFLDDYDCRKAFYWATFAGACGHTYGCNPIWQFWRPGYEQRSLCRHHWEDALHMPGSGQMRHGRALLESRPYLSRIPDQSLIASDNPGGSHHVQATRDAEGSYALVYCSSTNPVTIDLTKMRGNRLAAWWFDPRDGTARRAADVDRAKGRESFQPPKIAGPDWVLVVDDLSAHYPAPGSAFQQP